MIDTNYWLGLKNEFCNFYVDQRTMNEQKRRKLGKGNILICINNEEKDEGERRMTLL